MMSRLALLSGLGVALFVAVAVAAPSRSAVSLTLIGEGKPPQLLLASDRAEVEYVIDEPADAKPTGTLYARRDGQSAFTGLPLRPGFASVSGRHPRLHLVVPARFLGGQRLFYYAELRDPASGASTTIPAQGARAPETAWILHRPVTVRLGRHRFGHPEAAEMVVARAPARNVGWDLPFQRGPGTFLVGRDRSIWLEDTWKHRMLVWQAGKPNRPVRSVPLPSEGRTDVAFYDVSFGPRGTLYVIRHQCGVEGIQLFRIDGKTGKVLWERSNTAQDLAVNMPLRVCSDGVLYGFVDAAGLETTGTPEYGWMPLATRAGGPIPPVQQLARILWGYEPASSGRRFVTEPYVPPQARYQPREWRFATINRFGRLLRAWRIVSKTSLGADGIWPQLLDGRVVAGFAVVAGPGTLEHFFVRLDGHGLDAKASVPYRMFGVADTTDVRVGPDSRIYALATSPRTGIVIRRYILGR